MKLTEWAADTATLAWHATAVVVLVVCAGVGLRILTFVWSSDANADMLRRQAVERGVAEWAVDADGKAEWRWKDRP